MPAKYVRPYSKGQKNDFRDAEAIAEAVQRPTMKFVATKTADQLDLQALHRVRERLVSQRTGIINQIRAFLLERSIAVRQGIRFLRAELPRILAMPPDVLSPRMVRIVEDLACDWRRLDERVEGLSNEIETIARQDAGCERLMSVPGIGTIISSAMVAAIGAGDVFTKGRDFAAWLGLVPKQISTGDRTILGKVSRRGNRYLRVLFVQAAWVVLIKPKIWERHGLKPWLEAARKRLHHNVLAIALANKLARIAWSVLARGRAGGRLELPSDSGRKRCATYPIDTARPRKVVELVADKGGGGRSVPKGHGLGIAAHRSFVSYIATIVEVAVDDKGKLTVPRVDTSNRKPWSPWTGARIDTAIDCGTYVNPERIQSQIEGAAIMGMSLAKHGAITFKDGKVQSAHPSPPALPPQETRRGPGWCAVPCR